MVKNTELIARWLNAKHYISKYKPIPINEFLVFSNAIYPASSSSALLEQGGDKQSISPSGVAPCRLIRDSSSKELADPLSNAVVALAVETATAGFGALIFCRSRQRCQTTALLVSRAMPAEDFVSEDIRDKRKEIISDLRILPTGLDDDLAQTILKGVAFHRMYSTDWLIRASNVSKMLA